MLSQQDVKEIKMATYKMCRIGVRTLLLGCAASLILGVAANAATLKSVAVVNDDVVRLGDIFDGAEKSDTVLGNAPQLGKDMVLNSTVLRRIANNYAVAWEPVSTNEQIIVRRDSKLIDETMIDETIKNSLIEKGLDGTFTLTLANATSGILLPGNIDATVEVAQLNYTPDRDVFTATLAAPSAEKPLKTVQISGIINRMISVPSLNANARQGDIISASDIVWMDVPQRNLNKDVILDADDLIGKTPTRALVSKRPVKFGEIKMPQLVSRGDEVTILYTLGGMTLSAKGKSQQNGAEGDLVRVTNLSSAKSMAAQVTGDRVVTVQ